MMGVFLPKTFPGGLTLLALPPRRSNQVSLGKLAKGHSILANQGNIFSNSAKVRGNGSLPLICVGRIKKIEEGAFIMSDPLADFIKIGDRLTDNANVDISVTEVHTGGQGVVAVGTDRMREGEKRVVKTFRPDIFARSPRIRELFFHEGRTWISLWPHPNI